MDIADRIETALNGIVPVYSRVPEFTADNAPSGYIIYDITEKGADYSEGENRVNQYFISLGVFTEKLDFPLYERIKQAMYEGGFTYADGGSVGDDDIFPYVTHYYLDFVGAEERGGQ